MTYEESKQAVKDAVKRFPETFGLAGFPGELFRVSEQASYTSGGVVYVYTQRLMLNTDGCKQWRDFAKGTVSELQGQIVIACTCGKGTAPIGEHLCGCAKVRTRRYEDKPLLDQHEDACKDGIDMENRTLLQEVTALHERAPGTWIRTDQMVSEILETRHCNDSQPHGGMWWRTHHLVRQLGGVA